MAETAYWTPLRRFVALVMSVGALCGAGYVLKVGVIDEGLANPQSWTKVRLPQMATLTQFNHDRLLISPEDIHSGGPPKDGIPALTSPRTTKVGKADFLRPESRVVGVTVNGESRAYPISVLNHHEAINDKLGGVSLAIIYHPLCDSASVVDRRLGKKTYEFGISGLLYNSNVLLFDRQDNALWSQIALKCVSGPNAGNSLRHLGGWQITTFERWLRAVPDSTVVTFETGHRKPYDRNFYGRYFLVDSLMFPVTGQDARFTNKTPVIGVKRGGITRAYPIKAVVDAEGGVVHDRIQGERIELRADSESRTVMVAQAPDDAQVVHTFWFAWAATHPETEVYEQPSATNCRPSPTRHHRRIEGEGCRMPEPNGRVRNIEDRVKTVLMGGSRWIAECF